MTTSAPTLALLVETINAVVDRVNVLQGELDHLRRDLAALAAALQAAQRRE